MFSNVRYDIPAGLVVFLVALPLCLGISLASGAPFQAGLIAGIVGGIVVGLLSGSHTSVSGPAAGLTAVVAVAIKEMPVYEAFLLSVVIAGVFQIILGKLKVGLIGDFIPASVVKGMLAAIGLILILKEIPHLLGDDLDFIGDESFEQADGRNTFTEIIAAFHNMSPTAIFIGTLVVVILVLWEQPFIKRLKYIAILPAPLVAVFAGVVINAFMAYNYADLALSGKHLVSLPVVKSFAGFKAFFHFPKGEYLLHFNVWYTAASIALIASLETLLSLEAADEIDPYSRVSPPNKELIAQGTGNIVSGLIGGIPITAVIVRSSTNINAGARSKFSTIFHGTLLLVCVFLIPGVLNLIPFAALAGILIYVGYKLTKPQIYIGLYRKGIDQFLPFLITIIATLFSNHLLIGVFIGMLTAMFFIVRSNYRTAILFVKDENHYLVRLRSEVSFLNKSFLKQQLETIPENSKVLFDASRSNFVDKDILEVIEDFARHAPLKNISIDFKRTNNTDRDFFAELRKYDTNDKT